MKKTHTQLMTGRFLRQEDREAIERVSNAVRATGGFKPMDPAREAKILAVRRSTTLLNR